MTRRRLLGSAAGAAGGALASSLLGPNLTRALANPPRFGGSPKDVEHVVVLMEENRSFDHFFGTLGGVRGFGDPDALILSTGKSVFYQPDPDNADGYLLPWHLDTQTTSSQAIPSTSHAWSVQHSAWNNGAMDNWLPAHLAADGANGPYTMSYYERQDIPYHFALAEAFTLCDGYHCSMMGPTWPNRMYLMTGWCDPNGTGGGPITSNVVPVGGYTWTTYPERLTAAGISWHVYQEEDDYGCNPLEFFKQFQQAAPGTTLYEHGLAISRPDQFALDCANGTLPTVSWIIPTSGQSEHPAYIPASGADFLASKLEALAANPDLWSKTVFIINYDENDGLFDHVPPPVPPPGTPGEFTTTYPGVPIGAGFRVPCILVSPWNVGGWVASESFDHTSVIQFLETVTGVAEPNISAWRRQTFGNLSSALGFGSQLGFPALPPTLPEFYLAEVEVETLPAATIPGATQVPPVQEGERPRPPFFFEKHDEVLEARAAGMAAAAGGRRHAMPATMGRLEENRTTHSSDFPEGLNDGSSFPGRLAAVVGHTIDATDATLAYVTGLVGGNVAIIDASTNTLVSAIESGVTNPFGICATPDGSTVYVTNSGTNTVAVIDVAANTLGTPITVGLYPHGIAASPDGERVYVANTGPDTGVDPAPEPGGSNTVSVIDVASRTVEATVNVGEAPRVISITSDSSTVCVSCRDSVYMIDATSLSVSRVLAVEGVQGVAISPDGSQIYATVPAQDSVAVLDAQHGHPLPPISVGSLPWNIVFTLDGTAAYVTNSNSDTVSVIDTATHDVAATIPVGHIPTGITAEADHVWVANNTSGTISVIAIAGGEVATIEIALADEPTAIALIS